MNVGIAGTFSAINRHINALKKIPEVRIAGRWNICGDNAVDQDSGISSSDPEKILENADAFIITDAGNFSNRLATVALRNARHLYIYPSVIRTLNEVYQFIKLAREANVILKCGRTGSFNINGLLKSMPDLSAISMIEFQHIKKISSQTTSPELSDILLGDIEIINRLIRARNTSIKAKGHCMLSPQAEIINARLEFDNGSVVNYFCNIIGTNNEHLITVILKDSVIKYNIINNELSGWYLNRTSREIENPIFSINQIENPIFIQNIHDEQPDYLYDDLSSFMHLIYSGPAFLSIYDNGFEPYVLTDRILEKISKTLIQFA